MALKHKRPGRGCQLALALAAVTVPGAAAAHGFGRLYNLPVPFWLYAWAAIAVLLLSFLATAYFATEPAAGLRLATTTTARDLGNRAWVRALRRLLPGLKGLSVFLLLLTISTGWFGNIDPYHNFSMTFFWVVFLLGYTYLTAVIGNLWAIVNPWRILAAWLGRLAPSITQGRWRYPRWLGDWPALALYLAFIWLELFSRGTPPALAYSLLVYSAINFVGVWLVGSAAWFEHCEFLSVFLRLIALHAPLDYRRLGSGSGPAQTGLYLRQPCAGLSQQRPTRISTVVMALAMLSTTSFDGLRASQWWVRLFWADPTGIVTALAGTHPLNDLARTRSWYVGWETFCLVALPFVYFAAYLAGIALAKALTRSARPLRELALDFGYTLLPIALVYHLSHYATLILTQGLKVLNLVSDPYGWGWDLFGTATMFRAPMLPDMGWVWHTQVGLILFGHIVSIVAAHRVALRLWPTRRQVLLSQLPMLALMVLFTVAGLWILAQPLTVELMR